METVTLRHVRVVSELAAATALRRFLAPRVPLSLAQGLAGERPAGTTLPVSEDVYEQLAAAADALDPPPAGEATAQKVPAPSASAEGGAVAADDAGVRAGDSDAPRGAKKRRRAASTASATVADGLPTTLAPTEPPKQRRRKEKQ